MAKLKILAVDDNEIFRRVLLHRLSNDETEVRVAGSGADALRLALADPPDIVLLDVGLPGQNGFEVCLALRQLPTTRTVPVIMLTMRDHLQDKMVGLRSGANAYISKMVDLNWLSERLHAYVGR